MKGSARTALIIVLHAEGVSGFLHYETSTTATSAQIYEAYNSHGLKLAT